MEHDRKNFVSFWTIWYTFIPSNSENQNLESLPKESMTLIKWKPGYMVFKFGRDEVKKYWK